MSAIPPLSIQADSPARVYNGVARFLVYLPPSESPGSPRKLVVSGGGRPPVSLAAPDSAGPLDVGLQTHLLPDGVTTVRFSLFEGGNRVAEGTVELPVLNRGWLAEVVRQGLYRATTPVAFTGPCDASQYPYGDGRLVPWFDRPDAHGEIARREWEGHVSPEDANRLRQFVDQGFVVFEDLIDSELIDAVNQEVDDAIRTGYQGYVHGTSQRLELLHLTRPAIRKLWLDPRHMRFLDLLFGARARPCQSLTYIFGSQQDAHQDTIHLTPFPAGYMAGTWIALQDVQAESGELVVYPGSHREPRIRMHEVGCDKVRDGQWAEFGRKVVPAWDQMHSRYQPFTYRPRKGTVLVWHENLLHAGSLRKNPSIERRSFVIHSFAEGAVVFYDSTGLVGRTVDAEVERHGTATA